jgi:protease-4
MTRRRVLRFFLIAASLLLLFGVGTLLSLYLIPTPQVAVIRIESEIWGPYTTYIGQAMHDVGRDRAVRAVVLQIASPGGEVTASENLYFEVLKLRESKPVVASIDELAASGAYYVAAAADWIYAKPGSAVGNIGVISILPEPDLVDEELVTSGPFKLSGGPQVEAMRQMEMLKNTFLAAILSQRADRLLVEPEILSRGEIYLGLQAEQMGLVDRVGSLSDALGEAARRAHLRNYEVVDRTPQPPEEEFSFAFGQKAGWTAASVAAPPEQFPPGFYYRYVEPPQ